MPSLEIRPESGLRPDAESDPMSESRATRPRWHAAAHRGIALREEGTMRWYRTHIRVAVALLCLAAMLGGCSSSDDNGGDVAIYQGTLNGTWSGSGYSGNFSVTIAADGAVTGQFWGSDSGTITGTVNGSGSFDAEASGQAGIATWSGSVNSANGHVVSGSGTWTAVIGSGTWSAP
jgi:hypothetical protein